MLSGSVSASLLICQNRWAAFTYFIYTRICASLVLVLCLKKQPQAGRMRSPMLHMCEDAKRDGKRYKKTPDVDTVPQLQATLAFATCGSRMFTLAHRSLFIDLGQGLKYAFIVTEWDPPWPSIMQPKRMYRPPFGAFPFSPGCHFHVGQPTSLAPRK